MLALLLLAQYVVGKETSKDAYIIKKVDTCPDVGYFFKHDLNLNTIEPSCHLCFCQDNGTAICWSRENRRCNEKHYYHAGRRKRESRPRRSPGFSDIFFRDATRDIFNKQTPEQCKPFESSISEGCPPADWCTGCTVCDCDANGRWDCHILSFCPDNKGKKQMKKRRGRLRNKIMKRQISTTKATPKTTKKPSRKPIKKSNNAFKKKQLHMKQNKAKQINKKQNKHHPSKSKKKPQTKRPKVTYQKKNITKVKNKFNKKGKPKKTTSLKGNKVKGKKGKSINVKSGKIKDQNANKNDSTVQLAQTILKKVMASVEKIVTESHKKLNKSNKPKVIQKRSMSKKYKKGMQKYSGNKDNNKVQSKIINKINTKLWTKVSTKKANEKLIINSRKKREITTDDTHYINNTIIYPTAMVNTTTKYDYYKYTVDLKSETMSKHDNSVITLTNNTSSTISQTRDNIKEVTPQANELHIKNIQNNSNVGFKADNVQQKIIRTKYCNNSKSDICLNNTNYEEFAPCGRICELKKAFKKLVGNFGKRNSTRFKAKVKNFNILTNLKNIFRKIFLKVKPNAKNLAVDERVPFRKHNVIKTLCKNIESCKLKHTSKELKVKVNKLRAESYNILKSVRVIKGVLKLLDIKETDARSTLNGKLYTDNDVIKLNTIIKDDYDAKYGLVNLTETQRTQIKYIKENTLVFIKSIEKFAYILNDILNTLTNGSQEIVSHNHRRYARNQRISRINNNEAIGDKLKRLKNLFVKYNLVQNKFMKQMYDVLTTLESEKKNTTHNIKLNEVSDNNEKSNYTLAVENYTKKILNNLRKLKDLAEKLSSKNRKKRTIMEDDDAIEYLLTLMEYLFNKNKQLDISPANDGIDLLIDAIKSAPDIKLIKKKVLKTDLTQIGKPEVEKYSRRNDDDMDENNITSNLLENKFKTFESIDEEHEDLNKNMNASTFENIYQEEDTNVIDAVNKDSKSVLVENNNLEEKMSKIDKEVKKYKVFIDDSDDDDSSLDTTTTVTESETSTVANYEVPVRTSSPNKNEIISDNNPETNNFANKTKLDWIEETYNNEQEQVKSTQVKETTTQGHQVTRTIKVTDKYADPISSMSHEVDEGDKNTITENDSYKRQMNLLNSIDYGTEKTFSDSDSKEEKYNVESFPLYFV